MMGRFKQLIYAPVSALFHLLAWMPLWILYRLSDVMFVILYYIVRYRRGVVDKNLTESFPDKSREEIAAIRRRFYLHFCDYFFETIKLRHISDGEMRRRMIFENIDILDRLLDEKRSVVCYFSHCINWEWGPSITLWSKHKPSDKVEYSQVYRPLDNEWFDGYFRELRSRFGSVSYPKSSVLRDLVRARRQGLLTVCGFMSDQKPSHGDPAHITMFLNHPTAMISGTETLARRLDMSVLYMDMYRIRRGHYKIVMRMVAENPAEVPQGDITERYTHMLQDTINRNPSIWLWTHKRWKYPVTLPQQ